MTDCSKHFLKREFKAPLVGLLSCILLLYYIITRYITLFIFIYKKMRK
jgi:hypothetical protein